MDTTVPHAMRGPKESLYLALGCVLSDTAWMQRGHEFNLGVAMKASNGTVNLMRVRRAMDSLKALFEIAPETGKRQEAYICALSDVVAMPEWWAEPLDVLIERGKNSRYGHRLENRTIFLGVEELLRERGLSAHDDPAPPEPEWEPHPTPDPDPVLHAGLDRYGMKQAPTPHGGRPTKVEFVGADPGRDPKRDSMVPDEEPEYIWPTWVEWCVIGTVISIALLSLWAALNVFF